jgi:ankyrin repeat protein
MWQPLHCAAQHGHAPVIQLLLVHGAAADAANKVVQRLLGGLC